MFISTQSRYINLTFDERIIIDWGKKIIKSIKHRSLLSGAVYLDKDSGRTGIG